MQTTVVTNQQPRPVNPQTDLLKRVGAWVEHCRRIIENSHYPAKSQKYESLDFVKKRLSVLYSSPSYRWAAFEVTVMEKHLRDILPHPRNKSFNSSLEKLEAIITECKNAQPSKNLQLWTI